MTFTDEGIGNPIYINNEGKGDECKASDNTGCKKFYEDKETGLCVCGESSTNGKIDYCDECKTTHNKDYKNENRN